MDRYGRRYHRHGDGLHLRELAVRKDGRCFVVLNQAWVGTYAPHRTVRVIYGADEVTILPCAVRYEDRWHEAHGDSVRRVGHQGNSLGVFLAAAWFRWSAADGSVGAVYDPRENCYRVRALPGTIASPQPEPVLV